MIFMGVLHGPKTTPQPCLACVLSALLWLLPTIPQAAENTTRIKQAELNLQDDNYVLSAEINFHLSKKALHALQNGVALFWTIEIEMQEQRDVLWDKTVAEKEIRYRIQYHALLNMYRVKNQSNGEVFIFSSLAEALDLMSNLRDYPVVASSAIRPETGHYRAAIRVVFNRNELPLPLQPIAYLNPQWYLSSDWYLCPLTK